MFRQVLSRDIRRILIVAAGGGGDVVGALHTGLVAQEQGITFKLCSIPWERLVVDPNPGPIPRDCFKDAKQVRDTILEVSESTYVERGGRVLKPQIVNMMTYLKDTGYVYDPYSPVEKIARDLYELCAQEGFDLVVGVDVGGDILAEGTEETLLSPLADTYTLTVLKRLNDLGVSVIVGIYGPGCDGEIPRDEIIRRLTKCAEDGEFLFFISLTKRHAQILEESFKYVHTEASRLPVLAFKGHYGEVKIRRQLRQVWLDITCAGTYYITIRGAVRTNKLVSHIENVVSILHAREILNRLGVVTELDIEEALLEVGLDKITPEVFAQIVSRLREKIRKRELL